jgi:hypothetical protein
MLVASVCPFLTPEQYNKINEVGWEYDEGTGGIHFFIMLGEIECICFDIFPEKDKTFTLHFCEFDAGKRESHEYKPITINLDNLDGIIKMVQPYIDRGFEN